MYTVNENCHKPYKFHKLKLYYKLQDFKIEPPKAIDCEFDLYTSSHISYKFTIEAIPKSRKRVAENADNPSSKHPRLNTSTRDLEPGEIP